MSMKEVQLDNLPWQAGPTARTHVSVVAFAAELRIAALAFLVLVDAGLVVGAILAAQWLRFGFVGGQANAGSERELIGFGLVVSGVTAPLFAAHGLYDAARFPSGTRLAKVVFSILSAALLLCATIYVRPSGSTDAALLAPALGLGALSLVVWRSMSQPWYERLYERLRARRRVLIVGANAVGQTLAQELGANLRVLGYADDGGLREVGGFPVLGTLAGLERIVEEYAVDEVIVALPGGRRDLRNAVTRGFAQRVRVSFLADMGALLPHNFEVRLLASRPYVSFDPVAPVSWLKRASDLFLGGFAVVILLPLFLATALAIKLESPGPVFHRQRRIGMHGRPFLMLKFRSMSHDAESVLGLLGEENEAAGPMFKIRRDPRVTRVGRVLRRTSLDELPQLLNVLRGEMSLVGPRPALPQEVARYEDWQYGRLRVRPGMTGLWQVNGRSEIPFMQMVRLDLHYARNWSLWLDLEILLRTVPAVLSRRGAY